MVATALQVIAGGDAASATVSRVVADRLNALDEYLADLVDAGEVCSLTPFEDMFGFLSVGCLSAFVASRSYVTGLAPAVADLMNAARSLNFGSSSTRIDYRSTYTPFVAALHEVDRYDLFFDIKEVITLVVNAMDKVGLRGSKIWDDNLVDALRLKNSLLQVSAAVRADLTSLTRALRG